MRWAPAIRSRFGTILWKIQRNFGQKSKAGRTTLSKSEVHCINVVRKFDYENFLATLFIDENLLRRTAFALRAFNVELSQILDTTKTFELARIRFQFWNDIVEEIYSKNQTLESSYADKYRNFPLACELNHILSVGKLSKHWLVRLIHSRSDPKYCGDFPFQTIDELEKYCEASLVSVYYLLNERSIQIASISDASYRIHVDHIANHLGKAQGLTNVLRGIVHNAQKQRCYIPNDILVQTKCSHESFLRGSPEDDSVRRDAVFRLASRAKQHLDHVDENLCEDPRLRKQDRLLFLPSVPIRSYLERLEHYQFDCFHPKLYQRNGWISWKLWFKSKFI